MEGNRHSYGGPPSAFGVHLHRAINLFGAPFHIRQAAAAQPRLFVRIEAGAVIADRQVE